MEENLPVTPVQLYLKVSTNNNAALHRMSSATGHWSSEAQRYSHTTSPTLDCFKHELLKKYILHMAWVGKDFKDHLIQHIKPFTNTCIQNIPILPHDSEYQHHWC